MTKETFLQARDILEKIHNLQKTIERYDRYGNRDFAETDSYGIFFPPGLIQMQKQERINWLQSELNNLEQELEKL